MKKILFLTNITPDSYVKVSENKVQPIPEITKTKINLLTIGFEFFRASGEIGENVPQGDGATHSYYDAFAFMVGYHAEWEL